MSKPILRTRDDIVSVLKGGRMATVTFMKNDGSIRKMNGQFGNRSRHGGGSKAFSDLDKGIVTMHEFGAFSGGGWKSFRIDRVISIKANGKVYNGRMWHKLL